MCRGCQSRDTLSRFGVGSSPRRFAGEDRRSMWRALPLRFSDAQTVRRKSARRGPIAGDLDFVFDRIGDSRSSTSVVWLAIRTSRPYLSATNVRLRAHPASGPCVRASSRGPLPTCGSCTLGASSPGVPLPAMSMGDARPGRPVDDLGVTLCHAPQSPSTIGGAPGIQGALRRFTPTFRRADVSIRC